MSHSGGSSTAHHFKARAYRHLSQGDAYTAESVPTAATSQDGDENPVSSVIPDFHVTTLPGPEVSVARVGNNTPAEESLLEPSADKPVDTVTSIAAAVSDVITAMEEEFLPEGSGEAPMVPDLVLDDKSAPVVSVVDGLIEVVDESQVLGVASVVRGSDMTLPVEVSVEPMTAVRGSELVSSVYVGVHLLLQIGHIVLDQQSRDIW